VRSRPVPQAIEEVLRGRRGQARLRRRCHRWRGGAGASVQRASRCAPAPARRQASWPVRRRAARVGAPRDDGQPGRGYAAAGHRLCRRPAPRGRPMGARTSGQLPQSREARPVPRALLARRRFRSERRRERRRRIRRCRAGLATVWPRQAGPANWRRRGPPGTWARPGSASSTTSPASGAAGRGARGAPGERRPGRPHRARGQPVHRDGSPSRWPRISSAAAAAG
jgi:hypothetical protein